MRLRTLFFVCLLCAPALVLGQDASITMTYQGTLSEAGGQALNAERAMVFKLYEGSVGGEAIWTERHPTVDVVNGQFAAIIGSRSPINGDIASLPELYLGIQVGEDVEATPRMRVGGALRSHYAFVAAHATDVRAARRRHSRIVPGAGPVACSQTPRPPPTHWAAARSHCWGVRCSRQRGRCSCGGRRPGCPCRGPAR